MSQEKTTLAETEDGTEAGFVSRWSRLKHEAAKESAPAAAENSTRDDAVAENSGLEAGQASATRLLTDEDMPDIESLTPESDYTDFLSPGVSDALRKLALRKLFHGEAFNIRDGLDEYDGDYTQFEKLGNIVTSDMQHQLELEAQRKAEQLLQHEDQSSHAGSIQDVETNSDNDESVDENINIKANSIAQPDEIQKTEDTENAHEAEADTMSDEKPKQ